MVEAKVIGIGNVAHCIGMSSKKLHRWYMEVLSGYTEAVNSGEIGKDDLIFREKGKVKHIKVPILKPEHIGERMAIDEKNLNGDCYTVLSNRDTNKIALMANTLKTKHIAKLLSGIESNINVKSLTRDMASNYNLIGRQVFMNAYHVIDKFHVIKQALESLQAIRIRYRQEALSKRRKAKQEGKKHIETLHQNGDTTLQLLARSRGLLFKYKKDWTEQQASRAEILFAVYPKIKEAYKLIRKLRHWYKAPKSKTTYVKTQTKKTDQVDIIISTLEKSEVEEMNNLAYMLDRNKVQIINYFKNLETNAKAEALNRNMQRFINVNYGARNHDFFFFRLAKYFS